MAELGVKKIYALQLIEGKYYVGSTENFALRFNSHVAGTATSWTSKYPVLEVMEVKPCVSTTDENALVKKYMSMFGINNVRGGAYCSMELSEADMTTLQKELNHDAGACLNCGRFGHLIRDCPNMKQNIEATNALYGPPIAVTSFESPRKRVVTADYNSPSRRQHIECYRCGRANHYATDCYAKSHVSDYYGCRRCGRDNHQFDECYATYHANGDYLGDY